ncbi:aminotransferase class V-fold PLP-dependent enzyme [Candidatus Palauibacter soopunensis]|uniref:pyridoxal-phosphate-dependent aminotransferase family protein n=1 Tax=Candidatus Palauibacter soopunensis TaxID=3056739 RepID=UPI0023871AC2|nr:aminotransferase class V-fold PLP-dependent enzyme [Candidatus Palauibacter soopunensis]MDE2878717.1 aminotransferase class V-fold PLP-dependent enzyme [Candidatus Palauibacter soopunensis]
MTYRSGRHFLQLPGPTPVPERVFRAMNRSVIDHRGPEFGEMVLGLFDGLKWVFGDPAHVFIFPSSASGCWETALVNALSPGDRVLLWNNGFFASKWGDFAHDLGFDVEVLAGDWRRPADPARIAARLAEDVEDGERAIQAVLIVHNETSTGVTSDIAAVRRALDEAGHPALLMVDAVSSLAATPFRQAEWGVDVTVCGSQKGLMLPPGLGFCAVSEKALARHRAGPGTPRAYFDWTAMLSDNEGGYFPYTPPTTLFYGLEASLAMLREEGADATFARHARHAEATRRAVAAWGLRNYCQDPTAVSSAGTTVMVGDGEDADAFRLAVLERFDMSLGTGLGPLRGKVFRIGHLGDLNELTLMGALAGVEMGLKLSGIAHEPGGLAAAADFLARA